ncbi:hypothetical protein J2S10_001031 [Neobacillus ginsengisoli]|uniref:Uncharacterized protein n=1 Tax=Neobacillus ginsengisoli TaxID=904295 RepID=A0ABT9XRE9_9BACI|nr:hypothetical protein [Neobacillus ginsengisoli]
MDVRKFGSYESAAKINRKKLVRKGALTGKEPF